MIKYIKPNKLLMTINNVYLNLLIFMNYLINNNTKTKQLNYNK